jgi:serine/threonine protein kinase
MTEINDPNDQLTPRVQIQYSPDSYRQSLVGKTLRNYEIIGEIAAGNYGVIYQAKQPSVNRDVAIKMILPELTDNTEFAKRFEREAQIIAQLEHPHIVPLYDYWQDENGAFIVMRLLKHGSLRDVLDRKEPLSLPQISRIFTQIAEALSAAHQANVVHRDLKPGNILLDERGNAYLTDFGIAKNINANTSATRTGGIIGTPAYLAPEQIMEDAVTPQTDIYSLGIMLYELLTGQLPFRNMPIAQMMVKHLQDPVPDLGEIHSELPGELNRIVQKATHKSPSGRYDTVMKMAAEIRAAVSRTTETPMLNFNTARPGLAKSGSSAQPVDRNRYYLMQHVYAFWVEGVLENSLHGAALIQLGMKQGENAIEHPWDTLLRITNSPLETLPPGTRILEAFDKLTGKLLILGEPGGGKTTTLIELARDLLERATDSPDHPIPVIFNLSSWAESPRPLADWLVDELQSKYQVPSELAAQWVREDAILPLLDGLDEVALAQRDACVQAINHYRDQHGFVDMVVCSRIVDYDELTTKLKLNGAVVLQPLSDDQIDLYLARLGEKMQGVRLLLEENAALRQMSQSPLMLSVITLAYWDRSREDLPDANTPEDQSRQLFDVYVTRMFERRVGEKLYTPALTQRYLSWLAQQMRARSQSVFLIEKMQPTWLSPDEHRQYNRTILAFGVISQALIWGVVSFFTGPALNVPDRWAALVAFGLAGGVAGFILTTRHWQRFYGPLIAGIALGLARGLTVEPAPGVHGSFLEGLGVAVLISITLTIATQLLKRTGTSHTHIAPVEALNFSLSRIRPLAGLAGFLAGVMAALSFGLIGDTLPPMDMLALGMIGGGGIAAIAGLFMSGFNSSEVSETTRPNEGIQRSWQNAIRSALLLMLIFFLVSTLATAPTRSLSFGLVLGVFSAMTLGLSGSIIFGGFSVIQHACLRWVLYRRGHIPWNYAHFLDYANLLIFLRKVGGGYIFVHRSLMEYFANQPKTKP